MVTGYARFIDKTTRDCGLGHGTFCGSSCGVSKWFLGQDMAMFQWSYNMKEATKTRPAGDPENQGRDLLVTEPNFLTSGSLVVNAYISVWWNGLSARSETSGGDQRSSLQCRLHFAAR